jgi:hypothetical protein
VLVVAMLGALAWVAQQDAAPSVEPAQASDGFTITFQAGPDANGRPRIDDLPGTSHLVDPPFPTPAHLVGSECSVTVDTTNNDSVHPGNNLIVASGGSQATLADVEREGGVHTTASQQVTLGPDVTVTIVLGSGDTDPLQTSSVSGTATFTCAPPPTTLPVTTTTAPPTVPPPTVAPDSSAPDCPPGTYDTGAGTCLPRAEGG